jgi:DNA polymerase-3 subunit delta
MAVKKTNEKDGMSVINEHISSGSFARMYLLYGEERYLVNQYRDKLRDAVTDVEDTMNYARYIGEKLDTTEVIDFGETMPFMSEYRVIMIEGSGLFKKSCEAFAEKLVELPDSTIVIFVETEIDKRNKLYKTVAKCGEALCFDTPNEKTLTIWIRGQFKSAGKMIEDSAIYRLIEVTGSDMSSIKNEVDKLVSYCYDRDMVRVTDVNEVCVGNAEGHIFDMIDAISRKQQDKALHLYHELLENREPAMRILYLIVRQYDLMLKTKLGIGEGKNDSQIASVIGVPSWSVKKYREMCKSYTEVQLKDIVEQCEDTDYKLKTGQAVDIVAVELLIVTLSRA